MSLSSLSTFFFFCATFPLGSANTENLQDQKQWLMTCNINRNIIVIDWMNASGWIINGKNPRQASIIKGWTHAGADDYDLWHLDPLVCQRHLKTADFLHKLKRRLMPRAVLIQPSPYRRSNGRDVVPGSSVPRSSVSDEEVSRDKDPLRASTKCFFFRDITWW